MARIPRFLADRLQVPGSLTPGLLTLAAFALAALLSFLAAAWAAKAIESRSGDEVRHSLMLGGFDWTQVTADGLRVILSGTAPSESVRYRAIAAASEVVQSSRIVDAMQVTATGGPGAPDFSAEILRNADGVSLIGLVPADTDRAGIADKLAALVGPGKVADLLDTVDTEVPEIWAPSLSYAIDALAMLPRAKISVGAGSVAITAVSESAAEKARLEADLIRKTPPGVKVSLDISAPRPVIAPFSLRFVIDDAGARFDACSADSEAARDRILAAAVEAGAADKLNCTIGLGVPSPDWAEAVVLSLAALKRLGAGTVTFSDADISLVAAENVDPGVFDDAVGDLESNLPDVFSLKAVRTEPSQSAKDQGAPVFTANLAKDGKVRLGGRIPDERTRAAVESFAQSLWGKANVAPAMRIDGGLPQGWPVRVLAALDALGEVKAGSATVTADAIRIEGVSGATDSRDTVARKLAAQLGGEAKIDIAVRYDAALDPASSLPKPEDCERDLNAILSQTKIAFEPGKAVIAPEAKPILDKIAEVVKRCSDYPMEVGGHTDAQGGEEMNMALSKGRAQAVIDALMDRRVLTRQLTAAGYGETVPIADNDTEAGREANRRIEFRLIRPEDATPSGVTVLRATAATPRPPKRPERPGTGAPPADAADGLASPVGSGDSPPDGAGGPAGGPADAD
jgi:OOP family OmpA-OmpF porin